MVASFSKNPVRNGAAPRGRELSPVGDVMKPSDAHRGRSGIEDQTMGELTDKAKGVGNDIAGKTKEALGKATDNDRLRVEGEAQQVKGAAQKIVGDVKGAAGDKI
jgi:uncharacterized protein YjbJ (UPF0337 family)